MPTLKVGDKCRVISKSYRNILNDEVVIERVVRGKVNTTYHAKHTATGIIFPFLRRHLELVEAAPQPSSSDQESISQLDFFFPRKPERCGWCGKDGRSIANKFECSNSKCRNYNGK